LSPTTVLIHDAARPFVSHAIIAQVIAALDRHEGVIPALPVTDTLKRAPGGLITSTVSRESLWGAQTPQGFRFREILAAHRRAQSEGLGHLTDDAAVAEHAGLSVGIVPGEAANRKLTTMDDIMEADRQFLRASIDRLPDVRVGQGFDVHAFEPGNHVVLCGVKVPHNMRLKGHSDADVAMHALTDAILGAISEGDIGQHFPPSDMQWKGAESAIFLRHASGLVSNRGGMIAHTDITIVCEEPRIGPHVSAMRTSLSEILAMPTQRVAVKATTSEQLGFTGRREGIAAFATATVRLPL
ncbi:MAG: 2-C-methyl-D-erythritol 2,4-cyclodiphosphate synthase, partial [Aestuariivirgaceae bacterium]|nr:2-C-methyl-D-erythritol 2,4-cyclodiphosphate synthase [Aestuariivirgaceae bacterium]